MLAYKESDAGPVLVDREPNEIFVIANADGEDKSRVKAVAKKVEEDRLSVPETADTEALVPPEAEKPAVLV